MTLTGGGANNLLYRATGPNADVAVKFTLRDARDRAAREYAALTALQQLGLRLAPAPLRLEGERYKNPVVVQEWLGGEVLAAPLRTESGWERLLENYAAIHAVTPSTTGVPIRAAVYDAASVQARKKLVHEQVGLIPPSARPAPLRALLKSLDAFSVRQQLESTRTLLHVDANVSNFILRADRLYLVDWEGSGWGNPAFEIGNLMAHSAYVSVPPSRWAWVVDRYASLTQNPIEEQVFAHHVVLVVFWVARFARMLYEVPRGLDERLVPRPNGWEEVTRKRYRHYLTLAETLLKS